MIVSDLALATFSKTMYPKRTHFNPPRERDRMPPRPADHGKDVVDDRGSVIGKRYYTESQTSNSWETHTVRPDGSGTWHCGGPCGDLDYDEFGNT